MKFNQIDNEKILKIDDKPFFSIFFQLKSGTEYNIIDKIINQLEDLNIHKRNIKILKCFGHFDIAIFFKMENLDVNKIEQLDQIYHNISRVALKSASDSKSIIGFSWNCNTYLDFDELKNCWGICSIKLDLKNVNEPIKVEKKLINDIIKLKNDEIKLKIFGGLGWNEIIIIINSEQLKYISEFVYKIRKFKCILDVSTIPAVDWNCWNNDELETIKNCQILITHRSDVDFPIRELIIHYAEECDINILKSLNENDIRFIFGGFDILIPIVDTELNNIIKFLLLIRGIKNITKTNTIFSPIQSPPSAKNVENINDYLDDLTDCHYKKDIDTIIYDSNNIINVIENTFKYLHHQYIELQNDDYTNSLYFNLDNFFNDLYQYIEFIKNNELEIQERTNYIEQLKKIIQSCELSIYQRISGMQMSYLMEPKQYGFEKIGGIQRIIIALEAIPADIMLGISDRKWIGFCVFGSEPDFICQNMGEVISIPFEYKLKPEKCWGLGHEIGHLLINRISKDIFEKFEDNIREDFNVDIEYTLKHAKNLIDVRLYDAYIQEYSDREYKLIKDVIEEMCADYLNFRIVFSSNWNSFLKCTLNYLHNRGYNILSEDRLFRVIAINEHLNGSNTLKSKEIFKNFKDILKFDTTTEIHFKNKLDVVRSKTYIQYFKTCMNILRYLDDKIGNITQNNLLHDVDKQLSCGEIIESNSDLFSIYVLKSLIKRDLDENIDFKYRISAILSLYNYRFSKSIKIE